MVDDYISADDAAALLGVSGRQVHRYGAGSTARLRTRRIGRRVLFNQADVETLADELETVRQARSESRPASDARHTTSHDVIGRPDQPASHDSENAATTVPPAVPEVLKALEMIDRLQQQNQELWKTIEHWQARAVEAEQTVKLLMAPKDEQPAEVDQAPRSWWRRLMGR
jgi:hypothetical protein